MPQIGEGPFRNGNNRFILPDKSDTSTVDSERPSALSGPRSLWKIQPRKILSDELAHFLKTIYVAVRMDSLDGNRRHQPPKHLKLARTHFAVEDSIRVSIGHEGQESALRPHSLQVRRRIRTPLAQNINGPKRKWPVFEPCPLAPEVEAPLVPLWNESGKRFRRTIEHFHRIGPKRQVGISRHDLKRAFLFHERDDVIRKDSAALPRERRSCG